ncbi:MAG: carboxypeptidase regulatory-like domain-containing protein [Ahniella sp.]|nr:carboxypeptidase regulatory-like domain-containing protein [Ahniella sp.]
MNRLCLAVAVWFLPWVVAPVYAGEIQGTVRIEGTATGIGGATMLAASLSAPGNQFFAQSESDGTYSVTVPDGTYAVVATRAGFSSELYLEQPCCEPAGTPTPVVVGSGATVSGIDFTLTQGAQIQGRVVRLSDASALSGIVVRALVAGTSTVAATTSTDALGDYTLVVSAGSYDIEALGAGTFGDELFPARQCWNGFCRGTVVSQTIVGSEIRTGIDFSLAPPARISVPVRDAGTTLLIEGRVLYWFDDALSDAAREQATASGVATLELPGAGSVRLAAASLQCGPAADTECLTELFPDFPCALGACDPATGSAIVFTKGQVVTGPGITLAAGGSIGGLVSSAGLPVAGASVRLFAADVVDFSAAPRVTAMTDVTGAYRIGGLNAAPALVLAQANDFVPMLFDAVPCPLSQCAPASGNLISVQPGIPSQNISFALQGAGALSGRVVDAGRNEPLGGATVHVHTVTGAEIGSTTSQPDGTWRLADLPAAAYFVRFSHPQFSGVVFNGLPCVNNNCDVTFGTDVVVTVGAETPDIDAAMARVDGG